MSGIVPNGRPTNWRRSVGLTLRLAWLCVGLAGLGVSLALLVKARLGLDPWDVLNQGIARRLGIQIGWVVDAVGGLVLLAWIPLRQRLGVGTVINVVVVGLVVNAVLDIMPDPRGMAQRAGFMVAGVVLNGIATGWYIGAGLGPGPRDGLMTGVVARGHSIRVVRTVIEVSVLVLGFVLGGSVGVGTLAYALSIGPMVHVFLPRLSLAAAADGSQPAKEAPCSA
jgi:uncharacterized membrane protein YczE